MPAKVFTVTNTNSIVDVKLVASAANTATTTTLPLSGFTLPSETATNPVIGVKGIEWSITAGSANIYRGSVLESNLTHSLSGNGRLNQTTGFRADLDTANQEIIVVFSTGAYGTIYLNLSKTSGFTTSFNSEQTGQAG